MNLLVLKGWVQAKFSRDDFGANIVEYILLIALIALLVIGAVMFMRDQVVDGFNEAGSKVSNAPNP
jgi:Flp pilus assembly pilin Flp